MITRLALFDIDGTLLTTNGRAVSAMMEALAAVYGVQPEHDGYLMDGKTELCIVHELLAAAGLARDEVVAGLSIFWKHYAAALAEHVCPEEMTVYPGVPELLDRLEAQASVGMGLLTGNCPAAASIKLAAAGLADRFCFGVYGEAHEDRRALPGVALTAAGEQLGVELPSTAAVILGDTPNDIECARPLGLRTIAVATGRFDQETLATHGPDYLFADFSDPQAVVRAVLAHPSE